MDRLGLIKLLINKINAEKYLEIGVHEGYVINNIDCKVKIGIDPNISTKATIYTTSDEFFKTNTEKFDIIFVDGLHHRDQVLRDINNSLLCLNSGGYVVCHDMSPETEIMQRVPQQSPSWNGDCWKAWVHLRSTRPDLTMFVIDIDHGCGIIKYGQQPTLNIDCELNWDNLVKNREYWLNLIPENRMGDLI